MDTMKALPTSSITRKSHIIPVEVIDVTPKSLPTSPTWRERHHELAPQISPLQWLLICLGSAYMFVYIGFTLFPKCFYAPHSTCQFMNRIK